MHYQTFQVKMRDLRGGFSGFKSKEPVLPLVGGILHVVSKEAKEPNNPILKIIAGGEIVGEKSSRPFADGEFNKLPQKYKDQFNRDGIIATCIPDSASHIKPFTS